jgi:two-component system CheB/CheR fusion protein
VIDTGVGIEPEQLPFIYDEFYQVGVNPNTVRGGYGLGLSIVQRLAKLLGLSIEVDSEPGRGSTFSVLVPAATAERAVPTGAAAASAVPRVLDSRPSVLVVEDDPAVLNATRMLLKVAGYDVATAASLEEALRAARERKDLGLLITDYHLGSGETGLDVIASLRAVLGPDLGVVLVTGDTTSSAKELAHDDRVRRTSKPINADDLLTLMRELRSA